jgi:methionyl aminopeptidase
MESNMDNMTSQELESLKRAGHIASKALAHGKALIKPGASLLEVTKKIEEFIHSEGGELAFPVNISMNECAAHNIAKKDDEFKFKDELIKLDVGVHIDGFIGDTACTIDLSGKHTALVDASRNALNNAISLVRPGTTISKIGKTIEETITRAGFQPVRNLSGHGVAQYMTHCPPSIPNYDNQDDMALEEGMTFAIEPFATDGAGLIHETKNPEIFSIVEFKSMRVGFVREILKYIEKKYKMLPFSKRELSDKFSDAQIGYALKQFRELEIVQEYTPLVEKNKGLVSQAEHTVLVTKTGCEVLTKY